MGRTRASAAAKPQPPAPRTKKPASGLALGYPLPVVPELPVEIGQIVAEKYQVDSVIGHGGMGVVLRAHHIDLEQKVAIKFLLADVAHHADAAERFRREARAAAQIHSDHVVRVLDVGTLPDEIPYMVMEYLEGRDLGAKMASGEVFGIQEAVGYALEAIDAVGQAHAAGIVHRDLKPANLFLARRPDGSLRIKVLDFGISKSLLDDSLSKMRLTSTTTLIGSPLYMSPEQMQSARDVDARADIWSLGAILFEMLSGRPPYQADTLPQLCQELLTRDPPKLRQFRPEAPEALEQAIARCLMRKLEKRWPDVDQLADALAPFAPRHRSLRPPRASHADAPNRKSLVSSGSISNPGTLEPWGTTQQRKRPGKKVIGLLALAVLVVGGLSFAILKRDPSSPAAAGADEGIGTVVDPAAERKGPSPPKPETTVTPEIMLAEPVAPEPVREPLTPSSAPQAPAIPPARPQRPFVPQAKLPNPPATATASPVQVEHKPAASGDLSDFGGRR